MQPQFKIVIFSLPPHQFSHTSYKKTHTDSGRGAQVTSHGFYIGTPSTFSAQLHYLRHSERAEAPSAVKGPAEESIKKQKPFMKKGCKYNTHSPLVLVTTYAI